LLKNEPHSKSLGKKQSAWDRKELIERIFTGARTPILALSLTQSGPPTIVDCNEAASELIGYGRSEVVDRSVEFLYPRGQSNVDLWKPLRYGGKRKFDIVGHEIRRKDGTVFLASLKVSPLLNGGGKQVGSIAVVSDLTQMNRIEEHRLKYEDRLLALHSHSVQLGSAKSIEAMVDFTLEAMQATLNVRNVDFVWVGRKHIHMGKSAGARPKYKSVGLPRDGLGIVVKAANTRKEPYFIDGSVLGPTEGAAPMLSEIATPVLIDTEPVAVLNVESDTLNAFSPEDQKYLEFIAFHTATAIKRLRYGEKLAALHMHVLRLSEASTMDEIANDTLDAMEFALGFDYSDVRVVDEGWLRLKGARGMEMVNADLPLEGPGITVRAANSKATVRVADTRTDPHYVDRIHDKGSIAPTMLSELAVPVVVDGRTLAVLNVESTRSNAIKDSDQRLLEILAADVASALRRMHYVEMTRRYSEQLEAQVGERTKGLKASEQKLKSVIYGCPVPQFVIDRNHTVVYWNSALEQATGIKEEEVIGSKQQWRAFYNSERPCLVDLLVEENTEGVGKLYGGKYRKSTLVDGAIEATDYFPYLGNGGKWLHFTAAVTKDVEGNITGGVETLEDITELKKLLERTLHANALETATSAA
jgi:PAS domain S-box-containing protein